MRRKNYKFTDKHHSKGGVRSSIAGAISLLCTGLCLFVAYTAKGSAGNYVAMLGFIAMVCCVYGVITGKRSYREEECYYFFSRLGTIGNLILMIFWIMIVGIGTVI